MSLISVYTIINSVRQVLETPVIAIGEGTSPVISYNYGARRPGHVRKAMLFMGCLGIGYTLIIWILIERFPAFFISIFSTDAALMKDAIPALLLPGVFHFGSDGVFMAGPSLMSSAALPVWSQCF